MVSLLKNSKASAFKYLNRNQQKTIVLIPGWATDHRIFEALNLKFNYLLCLDLCCQTFDKGLLSYLKNNNFRKVSLFGLSIGGFLAASFVIKHPDLVDELILVGIRKEYDKEKLREIKNRIKRNKKAYLYKFYSRFFSDKAQMTWFKEKLLKSYCDKFDTDYLCRMLDYLESAKINTEDLAGIKNIKIIHGQNDYIAPIAEAIDIKSSLPRAELITIKGAGHIPFLAEDIGRYI